MDKNQIIVDHRNGKSNRTIAKELGVSKNTVNKYVAQYKRSIEQLSKQTDAHKIAIIQEAICSKPVRKKGTYNCSVFKGSLKRRFYELLELDEKRNELLGPNKQQATAKAIFDQLIKEGFVVGETTIRDRVRQYRKKQQECFVKLNYEYGEVAQYDFHQVKVRVAGKNMVYHQSTISLPKSNYVYGKLYRNEKMEAFLDSLVCFHNHCGGAFKKIVFDNMRNVTRRFVLKNEREYTDDIIKLSTYYGFKIETCNAYKANEKGHVETGGDNLRKSMFSFNYEFESEAELFSYYEKALQDYNKDSQAEFQTEKLHLLELPVKQYELGRLQQAKVNSYSFVSIDTNFYSVPDKYVGEKVMCLVYTNYINIVDSKGNFICKHDKKEGKSEYSVNILHYIDTLINKPKALVNSLAFKQAPDHIRAMYYKHYDENPREFLQALKTGSKPKSTHFPKAVNDIDAISIRQMQYTASMFGQEVQA